MRGGTFKRATLVGLAIGLALVLSPPAQAGTVDATQGVVFTAAPGETNNLTIIQSGNSFTVVDNWPLTALGPCVSTDMFTAVCTTTAEAVTAFLDDLDDTAEIVVDHTPRVGGGEGADTITVTADEFAFFREDDSVNGGPGDDILTNAGLAGGVMDGGAGDDEISTRARSLDIFGAGGNDLIDVRDGVALDVWGGPGYDRILGGPDGDSLDGGRGNDTLIGGAGPDLLWGDVGHDVVRGGRGHDSLSGGKGDDLIVGGAGRESAWGGRGNDTFLMRDGYSDWVDGSYGIDRAAIDQYDRIRFIDKLLYPAGVKSSAAVAPGDPSASCGPNRVTLVRHRGETFEIQIGYAGVDTGDTRFTATMNANIFFGPSHVFNTATVPAGLGQNRHFLMSSTGLPLGTDTISIDITSDRTGSAIIGHCSFVLTILPRPVVVDAGPAVSGDEGSPIALIGSALAPDGQSFTASWTRAAGAGVDPGAMCSFADPSSLATTITCTDDGTYALTLTASDELGPPVRSTTTLTVANLAPAVSVAQPTGASVVQIGNSVSVIAPFIDPGVNDTHTCAIEWGDGATSAGVVNEVAGSGACTGTHTYTAGGSAAIRVSVTDDDGAVGAASVTIHLNAPPDCSTARAGPNSLWPPNHALRLISVAGATDPNGDTVTLTITGVKQDEALNGRGDGNTSPDAAWVPSASDKIRLRAERSAQGDGRVYRIDFRGSDGRGGTCTGTTAVGVPHDRGGNPAIDTTTVSMNSFGP